MQRSPLVPALLATLVSAPALMAGHYLRQGDVTLATKVAITNLLVLLLATAIMMQRRSEE